MNVLYLFIVCAVVAGCSSNTTKPQIKPLGTNVTTPVGTYGHHPLQLMLAIKRNGIALLTLETTPAGAVELRWFQRNGQLCLQDGDTEPQCNRFTNTITLKLDGIERTFTKLPL